MHPEWANWHETGLTKKLAKLLHFWFKSSYNAPIKAELDTRPVFTSRRKELEHNRMQGVKMYRQGMSAADIAKVFDVSQRAVFQWVAAFVNYGQSGLVAKAVPGRPPKLTAD